MTIQELKELLANCYSKDLCYPKVRGEWRSKNKCWGMCAITALIVDDFFNTKFGKIVVNGTNHYFNIKDGKVIDLTAEQFKRKINYANYESIDRNSVISNEETRKRYIKLKDRIKKESLTASGLDLR